MPIRGFLRQRLPRLGKIHLGERVISAKTGNEYPNDLFHFRVPEEVAAVYGETPASLDIMVPTPRIEEWFPLSLKRYQGENKLTCRGDGELAHCYNEEAGGWLEQPCLYKECEFWLAKKCAEIGTLMIVLPEVNMNGGIYQIDTKSWYGINAVYSAFEAFLNLVVSVTGEPRVVTGAVFKLTRELQTLQVQEGGKRMTREKYILNLRPPALTITDLMDLAAKYRGAPASGMLMPKAEADDGEQVTDAEFSEVELPDPEEDPPADLVPNGAPVGPDLGQKAAWAALIAQVQGMGKETAAVTKSVLSIIGAKDAKEFGDLAGETEAAAALDQLASMCKAWQEQGNGQGVQAPAATGNGEPAPAAQPTPAAAKKKAANRNLQI